MHVALPLRVHPVSDDVRRSAAQLQPTGNARLAYSCCTQPASPVSLQLRHMLHHAASHIYCLQSTIYNLESTVCLLSTVAVRDPDAECSCTSLTRAGTVHAARAARLACAATSGASGARGARGASGANGGRGASGASGGSGASGASGGSGARVAEQPVGLTCSKKARRPCCQGFSPTGLLRTCA